MNGAWSMLLWFALVVAAIPFALRLLKRTPLGAAGRGAMRVVGALPIAPAQRVVTVEVGHGEQRRWLVLGVTAQQITTLHTMPPQAESPPLPPPAPFAPFAQLLQRCSSREDGDAR